MKKKPAKKACAKKIKEVMGEFKRGKLKAGRGKGFKVKSRKQAILIGMKKQREMGCPVKMYSANPDGSFEEAIARLIWEAQEYYRSINFIPDAGAIVEDVLRGVEEESGQDVSANGEKQIRGLVMKILYGEGGR